MLFWYITYHSRMPAQSSRELISVLTCDIFHFLNM
jgi:hypothetical protein